MGAHFCCTGKTTLPVTVKRRKYWWTNNPIKWEACVLGDDCSELVVTKTAPPVNEDTVEDHHNLWKLQCTKKGCSFFMQYNPLRCKPSARASCVCVCVCVWKSSPQHSLLHHVVTLLWIDLDVMQLAAQQLRPSSPPFTARLLTLSESSSEWGSSQMCGSTLVS